MKKEIFSGAGLGLLIGTIIGLSIAEITGVILAALTSLLAAFFGLRSSKEGETGNPVIIGTFGFICIISVFIGLFMRTHDVLSPSIKKDIQKYKVASFDTAEIKKIILFKEFGLVPEGYTFSKDARQTNSKTLLMTGEGMALCDEITDNSSLVEIKENFRNSGLKFQDMADRLSTIIHNEEELRQTLLYIKSLICKPPS